MQSFTQENKLTTVLLLKQQVYPWVIISLSAFFMIYKYVLQVSPSVMTSDLMRTFHVTGAGLGNLAACYFYTFLLMQIPVGVLLDRFSPRYLTSFAIAVCALGAFGFALAPTLTIAEVSRGLIGFGAAFATVSYLKMATMWFPPERFSLVAGLLATAAMVGAIAGEAPLAVMVNHIGWQHALFFSSLLGLIFAFLFWLLARDESPLTHKQPLVKTPSTPIFAGLLTILRNPQNWLLSFYSGLAFAPTDVFAGLWGVPFLMTYYHFSRTTAATMVSCAFIGLAFGAPLFGWFSDRIGKRRVVMQCGSLLSLLALLVVIYSPPLPTVLLGLLLFLFGFGTGSFMLGFVVGTEMNKVAVAATVVAVINTSDALWGAISEPLIGKFLDVGWSGTMNNGARSFSVTDFHHALAILPLYLFMALFLLLFIRDSGRKTN